VERPKLDMEAKSHTGTTILREAASPTEKFLGQTSALR